MSEIISDHHYQASQVLLKGLQLVEKMKRSSMSVTEIARFLDKDKRTAYRYLKAIAAAGLPLQKYRTEYYISNA